MADPFLDELPPELSDDELKPAGRQQWAREDRALTVAIERAHGVPLWDRESPIREVRLRHEPAHSYKKEKGSRGCVVVGDEGKACRKAKPNPVHNVPTMNETLTQDWKVYQGAIKAWKPWLIDRLVESGLPRGLDSVLVEGRMCFDRRGRRDQGNHRAFIEKALGDALAAGGWIADDTWDTYEFGNLSKIVVPGVRWTELLLFPNAVMGELPPAAAEVDPDQLGLL